MSGEEREERKQDDFGALQGCFVDGDAEQRARQRKVRRRALILSVAAQSVLLAAVIIVPLFAKPERVALANVMPVPPYRPIQNIGDTGLRHPQQTHILDRFRLSFFTPNAPVRNSGSTQAPGDPTESIPGLQGEGGIVCNPCISIPSSRPGPVVPPPDTPTIVLTHLDPAMLVTRVEPEYPALARQTHREGRVELHAIIAKDGSVQSLEVISGDVLFQRSAMEAVRQWRYHPTKLNGKPVQVDTTITVIYTLAQ